MNELRDIVDNSINKKELNDLIYNLLVTNN